MVAAAIQRRAGKDTRFFARISTVDKRLIEEAAGILGQSAATFVITEARKAATQVVGATPVIRLNRAETRRLMESLLAPVARPHARMKRALKLYRATVASDVNPRRQAVRQRKPSE
jgi:uncharacterized protein (DUF1778 family)